MITVSEIRVKHFLIKKTTTPLLCILLSCALTWSQMFPTMFSESCLLFKVTVCLICSLFANTSGKSEGRWRDAHFLTCYCFIECFLPVLIASSVCFGEDETSEGNPMRFVIQPWKQLLSLLAWLLAVHSQSHEALMSQSNKLPWSHAVYIFCFDWEKPGRNFSKGIN